MSMPSPFSPLLSSRIRAPTQAWNDDRDRKSTRLNSSHTVISYAVFCLKKKKTKQISTKQLNADITIQMKEKLCAVRQNENNLSKLPSKEKNTRYIIDNLSDISYAIGED